MRNLNSSSELGNRVMKNQEIAKTCRKNNGKFTEKNFKKQLLPVIMQILIESPKCNKTHLKKKLMEKPRNQEVVNFFWLQTNIQEGFFEHA